jgi:hypothetical protein
MNRPEKEITIKSNPWSNPGHYAELGINHHHSPHLLGLATHGPEPQPHQYGLPLQHDLKQQNIKKPAAFHKQ